ARTVDCDSIVTCFYVNNPYPGGHGEAVRPELPGGEVTRSGWRPLDPPARARPAGRSATLPDAAGRAQGHRAQHPLGPPAAHGTARAGHAALLLRAPTARGVRADRARARARRGGRRARRLGHAPRPPRQRAGPRRRRPPLRAEFLLPPLR